MEERLDLLDNSTMTNRVQFEAYKEQPSRSHADVEVLKKELEMFKQEVKKATEINQL